MGMQARFRIGVGFLIIALVTVGCDTGADGGAAPAESDSKRERQKRPARS